MLKNLDIVFKNAWSDPARHYFMVILYDSFPINLLGKKLEANPNPIQFQKSLPNRRSLNSSIRISIDLTFIIINDIIL